MKPRNLRQYFECLGLALQNHKEQYKIAENHINGGFSPQQLNCSRRSTIPEMAPRKDATQIWKDLGPCPFRTLSIMAIHNVPLFVPLRSNYRGLIERLCCFPFSLLSIKETEENYGMCVFNMVCVSPIWHVCLKLPKFSFLIMRFTNFNCLFLMFILFPFSLNFVVVHTVSSQHAQHPLLEPYFCCLITS